jgi:hypothetical protein
MAAACISGMDYRVPVKILACMWLSVVVRQGSILEKFDRLSISKNSLAI